MALAAACCMAGHVQEEMLDLSIVQHGNDHRPLESRRVDKRPDVFTSQMQDVQFEIVGRSYPELVFRVGRRNDKCTWAGPRLTAIGTQETDPIEDVQNAQKTARLWVHTSVRTPSFPRYSDYRVPRLTVVGEQPLRISTTRSVPACLIGGGDSFLDIRLSPRDIATDSASPYISA